AGAFNLFGFFVGAMTPDGSWAFPFIHALSTSLEALFCASVIVLSYQLCLRWFGRERLEGLMTTAQVFVAITLVMAGQLLPRLLFRANRLIHFGSDTWWVNLLPPAWFAGLDDAVAGRGAMSSWLLAGLGLLFTT